MSRHRHILPMFLALALAIASGCGRSQPAPPSEGPGQSAGAVAEPVTKTTSVGPVTAKVSVSPAKPTLGDPLTLTIVVTTAERGVEIHMPAFGEALGRFEITDFTPRSRTLPDGRTEASQRYTLEAPMSGPQTIPALRVEFVDRRVFALAGEDPVHELLTERIPIEVASTLPEGKVADELRPLREPLEDLPPPQTPRWPWILGAVIAAAVMAPFAVARYRAWDRQRRRRTACEVALARLADLERSGAADDGGIDAWYVRLSGIVRQYLEDRYGLHAPERTTEEFLREAGDEADLTADHRTLLRSFLQKCDRVKFAAYRPEASESREALETARRFFEETREGAPLLEEAAHA